MKRTGMLMKRSETVRNVGRSKFIDAEHDQRSEKFAKSRLRLKTKNKRFLAKLNQPLIKFTLLDVHRRPTFVLKRLERKVKNDHGMYTFTLEKRNNNVI